jgi:hypothetical protein
MWPNPDHPKEEDVRLLRSAAEGGDWFGCSGAAWLSWASLLDGVFSM